jgi:TolB protein
VPVLPILIGFLLGEIFLLALVWWGYDFLARRGIVPRDPVLKQRLLLVALLLPAIYAGVGTFGYAAVRAAPGMSVPELVGLPPEAPPSPVAPEVEPPPTLEAGTGQAETPPPAGLEATPTPDTPDPSESPAGGEIPGGKIVFACQIFKTGLRDQICIMNADGSGYRRLSRDDQWDHNFPSLSPDGRSMVYVAGAPRTAAQVYEMDLNSGAFWVLTDAKGTASAPEISPDGRHIVYSLIWENANTIWMMDRDGTNPRMVFGPPAGAGWDPVWSPDGQQILFASERSVGVQLFTISPDGSNLRQITNIPNLRGRSAWAPDNTAIASYTGEPWERELVIMNQDGSDPRLLTAGGNNLAPSFSPDGSWITFTSYRDKYREDLGCEIYIMRRDGSDVIRLTDDEFCNWQPRWGP